MNRVIVVGSGIAGLTVALHAARAGARVSLITKDVLEHANTRYAQGGIAGVMFDDDRLADHARDTLAAGAGLCDPAAVEVLVSEGPARIRELIDLGVAFDERAKYDPRYDDARPWLYGIATNLVSKHRRREVRRVHLGPQFVQAAVEQIAQKVRVEPERGRHGGLSFRSE